MGTLSSLFGAFSSIEEVKILQHVTKIHERTFLFCSHPTKIDFSENSELQTIESSAFESISIPSKGTQISPDASKDCQNLKTIVIKMMST